LSSPRFWENGLPEQILSARLEDADEILTLQKLAFQSEAQIYDDWTIAPLTQTVEELRAEFGRAVVLKAVSNGVIVGSVRGADRSGAVGVGRLMVTPKLRRRGIGGRLLRAIEACFPEVCVFELFTGSRSEENIRLYRSLGYEITGEKKLSEKLTQVFMRKTVRRES
jgi:GNAT superfamily N-acetyltransferase